MSMRQRTAYFTNLDGLRFIAAAAVLVHHIQEVKVLHGAPFPSHGMAVYLLGGVGVTLFFVLSGFLITHLLLEDRRTTGTIDVGRFYLRRVLRIWPVYLLLVATAFFLVPQIGWLPSLGQDVRDIHFLDRLGLFALFLPNLALVRFEAVPYAAHAWSIGVEEQFYLLWPLLLLAFRRVGRVLLAVPVLYLAVKFGLTLASTRAWLDPGLAETAFQFVKATRIDCMAIGGLAAYGMLRANARLKRLVYSRWTQLVAYALVVGMIGFAVRIPLLHHEVYALLFAVIITNLALNPASLMRLDHPTLCYLGTISYGVYMYHPLAIGAAIAALGSLGLSTTGPWLYAAAFGTTIGLAALSYALLERPFIALKSRFSVLGSEAASKSSSAA